MTFKQFMQGVAYLPARALSGLVNLVLGSSERKKNGDIKTGIDGNPVVNRGLLGLALDGIKFVGRTIADFIAEHKKAIAVAAWISLAAAAAVALTLFLWPAALTAVATFSIGGLSIAAIAGPSALAQIGLAAGLAAAAASVGTYVAAAVGNFASWIVDCCESLRSKKANSSEYEVIHTDDLMPGSNQDFGASFTATNPSFAQLHTASTKDEKKVEKKAEKSTGSNLEPFQGTTTLTFDAPKNKDKENVEKTPVVDFSLQATNM